MFSSQTTTEARLNDIRRVIQNKVTCEGNAFIVTVTEVCEMTSKLKIEKSGGLTGSCSVHVVYAPHKNIYVRSNVYYVDTYNVGAWVHA